ncbi:hypothetical protein SAMN05660657_01076 [Geodermatophilus amargosae]|uniref:HNH nuclease domain-containing protein n=1 Tax=Geodermatophilus amargosae TaxID=1296565 RepID=A0A1I6YI87_9ACTN|nr:hypothetical protein SAMN05660657_01076 [Geodermatophilus amargosae]
MATLAADLPADVAAACHALVDQLARMLEADGDERPIGELRTLVFADLLQRPWDDTRPPVTAHLQIIATLAALAGRSDQPGEVNGLPITAAQLRDLLAQLDALGVRTPEGGSVTLALADEDGALRATSTLEQLRRLARRGCPDHPAAPDTADCDCAVLDRPEQVDRYGPSAAQHRFVRTRDRTCRFPTCGQRVGWADADHVIPHAHGGPTDCANLVPLSQPPPAQDLRPRLDPDEPRRGPHRHHALGHHPHHPATGHATTTTGTQSAARRRRTGPPTAVLSGGPPASAGVSRRSGRR